MSTPSVTPSLRKLRRALRQIADLTAMHGRAGHALDDRIEAIARAALAAVPETQVRTFARAERTIRRQLDIILSLSQRSWPCNDDEHDALLDCGAAAEAALAALAPRRPRSSTAEPLRHIALTEDEFRARFDPIPNPIAADDRAFDGCLFETYGAELAFIRQLVAREPQRVWTVIEADGSMSIESGFHVVNRLGYLVTRHAADTTCPITVVIEEQSTDDARGRAP